MEDAFSADSDAAARVVGTEPDLKPIHIAVMIITLLHAVAIAVWAVVFLSSTKNPASVDRQSPKGPAADPRNIETKKDK